MAFPNYSSFLRNGESFLLKDLLLCAAVPSKLLVDIEFLILEDLLFFRNLKVLELVMLPFRPFVFEMVV